MVQEYKWYKFESDGKKEAGRPEEYKVVLIQDNRLKSRYNLQGIGLGYCWGYEMDVVSIDDNGRPIRFQTFRPAFWATVGNDNPEEIFEKPDYLDVTKKVYPEYHAEFRFKSRGRKAQPKGLDEEGEFEELDLDI